MANCATLSNKGLISAGNISGTAIVRASTYNKKYHAFCTVKIINEDDIPTPSDWSTNTKKILLHQSGGNNLYHSLNASETSTFGYGIEIDSSDNWKIECNVNWITNINPSQGNGPTSDYGIFFNINDNTSTTNRRAILTGTNLVSNDTSIFLIMQEGKLEESIRKLFIYRDNNADITNSTYQAGTNTNSITLKIVPKVYQNNTWINTNFEWGCNILTNNDYIDSTSPSLNGSLTQFNTTQEIIFYLKEPRPTEVDFNIQVKSNSTNPNQAISDVIISTNYTAPEPTLDGKMNIRIFKNNTEITLSASANYMEGTISNLNKDGETISLKIKTYRGSGTGWVESNTKNECYGADIISNNIGLSVSPELTGSYSQFYGEQTLTITIPQNIDTSQKGSILSIFSNTDGNTYFNGLIRLSFVQNAQTETIISIGSLNDITNYSGSNSGTVRTFYYNSNQTLTFSVTSNTRWRLYATANGVENNNNVIFSNPIDTGTHTGYTTGNPGENISVTATLPLNSNNSSIDYTFYLYGFNPSIEEMTNQMDVSDIYTVIPQNLTPSNWGNYISLEYRNNTEESNNIPYIECFFDVVVRSYFPYTIYVGNLEEAWAEINVKSETGTLLFGGNGAAGETIFRFTVQQNNEVNTRNINIYIRSRDTNVSFDDIIYTVTQNEKPSIDVNADFAYIKERFIKLYRTQTSTVINLYSNVDCKFRTTNCSIENEGSNNTFYVSQLNIVVNKLVNDNVGRITLYDEPTPLSYDEISIKTLPESTIDYIIK